MPQKFRKKNRSRFTYSEIVECIELQHSGYYDQCMCGHEFEDDYDWERDEAIWDALEEGYDY